LTGRASAGAIKKIRYQAGLITDFVKLISKIHSGIRPGSLSLTSKRRSNREERSIPVALIIMIIFAISMLIMNPYFFTKSATK
jgi:LytS/YehU family sensor histidine kinase